ncbi:hypothetical protein KDL45_04050 [bacterium]|nr:hypothetical protein [bacterium]
MTRWWCIWPLLLAVALFGGPACGDDDDDAADEAVGESLDDDEGPTWDAIAEFPVGYTHHLIKADPAPDNPVTGTATPDQYNWVSLFRFRPQEDIDAGEPAPPVDAVVIFMPGFAAGATQLFELARQIVVASEGRIEVWVPDRRHNWLEDQFGMDLAEERRDPWIAYSYYYLGEEVEGHKFKDPNAFNEETAFVAEWGLDTIMHDLRAVVRHVPGPYRATNVFLAGDSRGVAFAQAFAAYEFEDGRLGCEDLAGLILWDGGQRFLYGLDEESYRQSRFLIRSGVLPRTFSLEAKDYFFMETFAMATTEGFAADASNPYYGPDGFFPDRGPFQDVLNVLTRGNDVRLTNEAVFGMILDSDTMVVPQYAAHMGKLGGGELGLDPLGMYPAEEGATYTWRRWDELEVPELIDSQKLAKLIYAGPSNFIDPYYASRLDLDMTAAQYFETEGTWAHNYFHFFSSRVDVPVFAVSSLLYTFSPLMDEYRQAIAPVRGTTGPRTDDEFHHVLRPEWSHLDALLVEPAFNPVVPALVKWIDRWKTGQVQITPMIDAD